VYTADLHCGERRHTEYRRRANLPKEMSEMPRIGLQLYTLRAECARDFEAVLRSVGELGFEGVELFDLHGHAVKQVRTWLDGAGLVAAGRHAGLAALESDLPAIGDELSTLGTDRLALSWIDPPESAEDAHAVVRRIAALAEDARERGVRLGFHNHWGELKALDGGRTTLDLLRALPSDLLWLELDLGWIWAAGANPTEQLALTSGRCPLVHVKDLCAGPRHTPVGDGDVGYARVLPAVEAAGTEWLIVEQDEIDGDPLRAVARSLAAVRHMIGARV
jgi:sugar phosphate isomerase/epimerase